MMNKDEAVAEETQTDIELPTNEEQEARSRKQTAKGIAYAIETSIKQLEGMWRKLIDNIRIAESNNGEDTYNQVIKSMRDYEQTWRAVVNAFDKDSSNEHALLYQAQNDKFQNNMISANEMITKLRENQHDDGKSIASRKSTASSLRSQEKSIASRKSTASSLRSQQALVKAEAAAATERLNYLKQITERKKKIAARKAEMEAEEAELELMKAEQEVAEARARETAMSEVDAPQHNHNVTGPSTTSNDHARKFNEQKSVSNNQTESMTNHLLRKELLATSLQAFDGRPTNYRAWKASFKEVIKDLRLNSSQELNLLVKWIGKAAEEFIKPIRAVSIEDASRGLKLAWEALERKYGSPEVIENDLLTKLKQFPPITIKDRQRLLELSFLLMEIKFAKDEGKYPGLMSLDSAQGLHPIVAKLPYQLRERWTTRGSSYKEDHKVSFPPFRLFVEFIDQEARKRNDPSFITESLPQETQSKNKPKITKTFVTKSESAKCVVCENSHSVDMCDTFKQMLLSDREAVVKQKGLCRGCLHRGHIWKECKKRKTCEICKKPHPTILHRFKPIQDNDSLQIESSISRTSNVSMNDTTCISSIVPVWLEHGNKCVLTYALLDEQSDACFLSEDVKKKLNVSGVSLELQISTVLATGTVNSEKINGLTVRGLKQEEVIKLPPTYTRESIPATTDQIPTIEKAKKWAHFKNIEDELSPLMDIPVGLLIGATCPKVLTPRDVIPGIADSDPYAVKTVLGWSIVGVATQPTGDGKVTLKSCRTNTRELIAVLEKDFIEVDAQESALSIEDKKFLKIMEDGLEVVDGHLQLPLPFKMQEPKLPNNKWVAERRLHQLKSKLKRDPELTEKYTNFMEKLIEEKQAEKVPENEISTDAWYLPHHNVKHPRKPDKVRIVLDCAARCEGISLNDILLKGPNLTNNLIGVLMRFREEAIAVVGDIEGMYYQVRVKPSHRDFLRFLWWENGELDKEPSVYRMTVHVFGAGSSPGCANYALKQSSALFDEGDKKVRKFVNEGFYVDDGLTSLPTAEDAIKLIDKTATTLKNGGFRLHKFLSNSPKVMTALPPESVSMNNNASVDLSNLPRERTLGVLWNANKDQFEFEGYVNERPATRRGILSTVSSIFDPLGFIGPYVLIGKRILQRTCVNGAEWDDPVDERTLNEWKDWKEQLEFLENVKIDRCYKPASEQATTVVSTEIHHFSDASEQGYGQCSYLRLVDNLGKIKVSLLISKCRVTPLKATTMPRLELVAATLSAKMAVMIRRELKDLYDSNTTEYFWSDSQVVLGYIKNESRRFHTFVANRVETIRNYSNPEQWHYVPTNNNPADIASRGKSVEELKDCTLWWHGPDYLSQPNYLIQPSPVVQVDDCDIEVKALVTHVDVPLIPNMLKRYSSWNYAKRIIARCIVFTYKCRGWRRNGDVDVSDMNRAEKLMIKVVQHNNYQELDKLKRLDPFLDEEGILRVGGRIRNSTVSEDIKHPIILPAKCEVTRLVITHYHAKSHHQGRGITLNTIRNAGFWIIGGTSTVSRFIHDCVICRKLRRQPEVQKMADIPSDRLTPTQPFINCGVDMFGPFYVKNGRKEEKRYGVLFTCLVSRGVHIEVAHSLSTDSFINAFRRMIARRGTVRMMRSDRGTNFVGARKELREALNEMDHDEIKNKLMKLDCDWVWNVPAASHHGGVWERMIRTTRSILDGLMINQRAQLNDEMLITFMTEAEGIVNSRPLCNIGNETLEPLTPAHILMMKPCVPPPPGNFNQYGKYSRKLWKRVQHLTETFWARWRKEYIHILQERKKWTKTTRNLRPDDIVLIVDGNVPRNKWSLARVMEVLPSADNLVRKVKLFCGKEKNELLRPVTKLVLLVPAGQ